MFSTCSIVTQLKPNTITEYVEEAEEHRWALGDVAEFVVGSHDQQETESQNLGSMLLGQSTSLKKIHGYFSQLEPRKCCLHLACQRSTLNFMRVVPTSRTVDDGSAKSSPSKAEVKFLENKELRAFKHAYLCAVYPVLAAPDPPSPLSPSPLIHERSDTSTFLHRTASYTPTEGVPSPSFVPLSSTVPSPRPLTPYSLHDSGVEESEETGLIPMESICEQLQRAFRLSSTVFQQYELLIVKTYSKKSFLRILAEELSGQLAVLETNSHPFYSPKHFITQNGYDLWQKQERTHISELLNKFWNSSLPFPRDNQDLIAELHSVHEDYHILLKKLLVYENQFRQGSEQLSAGAAYIPLSSASCRLLLEFGLRYGIGELFRKALLLQTLTSEFCPAVGYLAFMNNLVITIHQMLPRNKMTVVMVKQEFDILYSSLRVLKVQSCKALSQMKSHFPGNKPAEGLELLLMLLKSVVGLMSYLAPANLPQETFDECLKSTVQSMFKPAYEMFKSVAQEDLNKHREGVLDPRLLNILIQDIREDVSDHKANFEKTFEKYFSISKMAATSFYQFLMKDVDILSQSDLQHRPLIEIDLRMLALAYRLNTLDSDWISYITPQEQTWRVSFLSILTQWTTALRVHLQNLVLDAIAGDAYVSQNLDLPQPVLTYQTAITPSDTRSISFSFVSISPSINSAFRSILSSVSSTPHQVDFIHQSAEENQVQEKSDDLDDPEIVDFGLTEYEMRPSSTKSASVDGRRSLDLNRTNDRSLYFSAYRRFSLPVRLDAAKSDHQFSINQECSDNGICSKSTTQPQTSCNRSHIEGHSPSLKSEEIISEGTTTPTRAMTPLSSYSDENEENGHDNLAAFESGDEEFTFPPLKVVSHRKVSRGSPSDFSKPVFSKPRSFEPDWPRVSVAGNRGHLLGTDAPHSMSSRASSITPDLAEDIVEYNDVSFPEPADVNQAVMPVSGSAIDVLILLQRLCCFSNNLVNIILTDSPSFAASRKSSFQTPRQLSSNSIDKDESETFPFYERTVSSVSTQSSSSSFSRSQLLTNVDGRYSDRPACASTKEENSVLPHSVSQTSAAESDVFDLSSLTKHRIKLGLHLKMLKAMCNMLEVYASNMLCMDLCATPRNEAKRLVGPKLIEFIESQQVGGLIWGCRHQAEATYDCLYYFNRKSKSLIDCHEPVTQHMCTRINNVFACLHILDKYGKKLLTAFKIEKDEDTFFHSRSDVSQDNAGRRNSTVSEDYVYVSHHSVQDNSLMEDSLGSDVNGGAEDVQNSWSYQSKQVMDMTRQHLMAILSGMYRLLAYKLNLFVKDGLYILLNQKTPDVTVVSALAPITSFLQKYLDSLSTWLYHNCFRRVLDNLWVLIVQGIEFHADELRKSGTSASILAHNWMLTISHLIKFMNNNGKGIKKDLLLAQANDVIFQLQLYTLSTAHLIVLFDSLRNYYFEGDHLTLEENATRNPPAIIHRIHHELQSLRKSFSGAELLHWIIKNKDALPADLSLPSENVTRESAIIISQILLDHQFIVEVESECSKIKFEYFGGQLKYHLTNNLEEDTPHLLIAGKWQLQVISPPKLVKASSATPISFTYTGERSPYPQVIIYSQGPSEINSLHGNRDSCSSDSTIENVQTAQAEVHYSKFSSTRGTPQMIQSSSRTTPVRNGDSHDVCVMKDQEINGNHIESQKNSGNIMSRTNGTNNGMPFTSNGALGARNMHSDIIRNGVNDRRKRRNTDSLSEGDYCEENDHRHTPFSSVTEVTFSNNSKKFEASTRKFYCIHQSSLHPGTTNASSDSILSDSERYFSKLKSSKENLALIEQCFTHKLGPIAVAAIIAGRKKSDSLAKSFVKQLPRTVSEKVSNLLDEPIYSCIIS